MFLSLIAGMKRRGGARVLMKAATVGTFFLTHPHMALHKGLTTTQHS
jgi:hypothetical protein